jgi:superoxide dismutase, Cu-Zn family
MKTPLIALAALALSAPLALAQDASSTTVEFVDRDGTEAGTATLRAAQEGVLIELEVRGLPAAQWVAFHIHENGECDPADDFESAGGHFNPTDREHGYFVEGGPHAGDMPNQYVGADGVLRAEVFNSFVTMGEGEADVMGRSLVIHDGTDDHESQPSGDAGGRIACAVID